MDHANETEHTQLEEVNMHVGNALTQEDAFTQMCVEAIRKGKLIIGARQVTKSIIGKRAKLILMSQDISEPKLVSHVDALAKMYDVPIVKVPTKEDLATYVDLGKRDVNGVISERYKCAVSVIEDFGRENEGQKFILSRIGK